MASFLIKWAVSALILVVVVSLLSFLLIKAPPGGYASTVKAAAGHGPWPAAPRNDGASESQP